ncbi:haloacid dehalogenase [Bordetella pertussis]|nr:haloacid dehalogenase [Bordetella pertussis]
MNCLSGTTRGLARPQGAPEPELQSATLAVALPWLQAFRPAVR